VEENLVAHLGVLEHLVPRQHFDVEVVVIQPEEPPLPIRHGLKIFLAKQPLLDLRGQVTYDKTVERGVGRHQHILPLWRLEFPVHDVIDVSDDLLDGVFVRGFVDEIIALRLLELEDRDGIAGFVVSPEYNPLIVGNEVGALCSASVERNIR
jgi:hypothetical protein